MSKALGLLENWMPPSIKFLWPANFIWALAFCMSIFVTRHSALNFCSCQDAYFSLHFLLICSSLGSPVTTLIRILSKLKVIGSEWGHDFTHLWVKCISAWPCDTYFNVVENFRQRLLASANILYILLFFNDNVIVSWGHDCPTKD